MHFYRIRILLPISPTVAMIFEVGGVFLFVVGMMYLTVTGKLGDMFRDRAAGQLFLVTVVTGFALYHWGGMIWDQANMPEIAPETQVSNPEPPPPPEPPRVSRRHAKSAPPPVAATAGERPQVVIVEEVPAAEVFVPPAEEPSKAAPSPAAPISPASDPYESKAKRGIKAVGRFLHLRAKHEP